MDPRTERIAVRLTRAQAITLGAMSLVRGIPPGTLASEFVVSCIEEHEARQAREEQVRQVAAAMKHQEAFPFLETRVW